MPPSIITNPWVALPVWFGSITFPSNLPPLASYSTFGVLDISSIVRQHTHSSGFIFSTFNFMKPTTWFRIPVLKERAFNLCCKVWLEGGGWYCFRRRSYPLGPHINLSCIAFFTVQELHLTPLMPFLPRACSWSLLKSCETLDVCFNFTFVKSPPLLAHLKKL